MDKDISELTLSGPLNAFPGDPNLEVCPTRAISWDITNKVAKVSSNSCIGCGLCVVRCPYGAISLADGLVARVETSDPDSLVVAGEANGQHSQPTRNGQIATLDAPAAAALPENVSALDDTRTNLFVRNLLNEVGVNARVRRRGDTNMRIDAAGITNSKRPFVAEIETGIGVLDSPRALLEDVAVLHARYCYAVADIDPVSIVLTLPNVRVEYYRVMLDIEAVLNVRCRTITIGVLIALLWNGSRLDGFKNEAFAVRHGTLNLAESIDLPETTLIEPYPGAFTPAK
jgi:ferredoxin